VPAWPRFTKPKKRLGPQAAHQIVRLDWTTPLGERFATSKGTGLRRWPTLKTEKASVPLEETRPAGNTVRRGEPNIRRKDAAGKALASWGIVGFLSGAPMPGQPKEGGSLQAVAPKTKSRVLDSFAFVAGPHLLGTPGWFTISAARWDIDSRVTRNRIAGIAGQCRPSLARRPSHPAT